jgi:hypothetical protein
VTDLRRQQLQAAAALRLKRIEAAQRYAADPWRWLVECAVGLDPLRAADPIGPFPAAPYLQHIVTEVLGHRRTIVWKPRRMFLTWEMVGLGVALAVCLPHQRVFYVSRRMGDDDSQGARELLWRAAFILDHLTPPAPYQPGKHLLTLPNGSTIGAVSSEPRAVAGLAATFLVADEFGFWEDPEASLAAMLPTLESRGTARGHFVGVTTTEVGPFETLLYDGLRADEVKLDEDGVPLAATEVTHYPGLERRWLQGWTNPENGFRVLDLNLEADEEKRAPEALQQLERSVLPMVWEKEYRKRFLGRGGQAIFGKQFRPDWHVADHVQPIQGEPLICGIDFGYHRPAAVALQLVHRSGGLQCRVYRALLGDDTTTRAFVHVWLAKLELWFPEWRYGMLWACDHAGNRTRGEDDSALEVLRRDFSIKARSRYTLLPPTLDLVRDFLQRMCGQEPALLIDRNPDTAFLRRGFAGEYRYGKATDATPNPDEPERGNAWRDVMDALRYGIVNYVGPKRVDPERRARLLAAARRHVVPGRRYAR